MAVMDIVIQAQDQASKVFDDVTKSGSTMGDRLERSWKAATVAGVALGGGILKLTGRAHEVNDGLRRVAATTGESEESLRDMTLQLSDATFGMNDVVAGTERLVQAGVNTREEFEKILPVMDDFSDATGMDIVQSIDAFDRVLSALNIPLEEAGEHVDTMTFLTQRTTVSIDSLGMLMRREAPAIKDMGLSFDDVAVAMAGLEAEGIRGPRAIMTFQEALKDAEGSSEEFWKTLGVTNETLEEQRDNLGDAAGLTEELAEINNSSLTVWDRLKNRMDKAMVSAGTFLEPVRDMAPALMALGPVMGGVGKAMNGLRAITLSTLAPFLAIIAVAGALYLAWTNNLFGIQDVTKDVFDRVSGFFDRVKENLDSLRGVWEGTLGGDMLRVVGEFSSFLAGVFGDDVANTFVDFFVKTRDTFDDVSGVIRGAMDTVREIVEVALERVLQFWDQYGADIVDTAVAAFNALRSAAEFVFNLLTIIIESAVDKISRIIRVWLDLIRWLWDNFGEGILKAVGIVWDQITAVFEFALNTIQGIFRLFAALFKGDWDQVWAEVLGILEGAWELIVRTLENALKLLGTILVTAWEVISDQAAKAWNAFSDWIAGVWDGIVESVTGKVDDLREGIQTLWKSMMDWVTDRWQGFVDGIISYFTRIPKAIGETIDRVRNLWSNLMDSIRGGGGGSPPMDTKREIILPGDADYTSGVPRYHGGGIFSTSGNRREGPAMLEDGEGVFTREQMRNLSPRSSVEIDYDKLARALARAIPPSIVKHETFHVDREGDILREIRKHDRELALRIQAVR